MSFAKISKALLEMSRFDDEVLHVTDLGNRALAAEKLGPAQTRLLERIDGFRSMEQLFSLSGDIVGVHGVLGNLLVFGYVAPDRSSVHGGSGEVQARPEPAPLAKMHIATGAVPPVSSQSRAATAAPPEPKGATCELDTAKHLLSLEVQRLMAVGADRMLPRIEACKSIADVYDLIVKLHRHLSRRGGDKSMKSLDRLISGLEAARKSRTLPVAAATAAATA